MQGKNKIYTIELESLENLPPLSTQAKSAETAAKAQSAATTPTEAAPIAKTDGEIIAEVINRREVKDVIDNLQGIEIPKEADVKYFYELVENSLDFIKNKENLITDLQAATDSRSKPFWDFVMKPTLKDWDFKLHFGNGETRIIKIFKHVDLYAVSVDNIKGKNRVEIHKYNKLSDGFDIAKKIETTKPLPQAERLKKEKQYNQTQGAAAAKQLREMLKTNLGSKDGWSNFEYKIVADDEAVKNFISNRYPKPSIDQARAEIQTKRKEIETLLDIKPIAEFGENYAEHYRDDVGAIEKLLLEKQGQVAGAFYREGIGDITLAWGEKGTGKSDGWGLAKIAEYHPEVLDKLDKLIQDLPIVKETENRYKLDNGDFFISIRKDFDGEKQNWVLTALERDESIARRRTDLPSSQSEAEKTTSANASADSTTKTFNQADIS